MAAEPKTLGRYQLGRVLGKGAMGSVCEARAVARLNHPNIVQVYDFGEEGDTAYLVMELIDGKELKSALSTGRPFDRKECVRIMCELLDALDFAHEAKVIHRDIKPANVMFDSQGRTKLTDFGVARKASRLYRRPSPPSSCRATPLLRRPLIRRHCDPGRWSSNSGARSRTAMTRTTSSSTCGSFRRACMHRSRRARPPSCAAAPPRTTAAPAPWQEPTGRGSRGASRAPKPSPRR